MKNERNAAGIIGGILFILIGGFWIYNEIMEINDGYSAYLIWATMCSYVGYIIIGVAGIIGVAELALAGSIVLFVSEAYFTIRNVYISNILYACVGLFLLVEFILFVAKAYKVSRFIWILSAAAYVGYFILLYKPLLSGQIEFIAARILIFPAIILLGVSYLIKSNNRIKAAEAGAAASNVTGFPGTYPDRWQEVNDERTVRINNPAPQPAWNENSYANSFNNVPPQAEWYEKPQPQPVPVVSAEEYNDKVQALSAYEQMYKDGVITEEEYTLKRKQILGL